MSKIDDEVTFGSKFQKVGVWLAVAFFILSVIMVIRNHGGMTVFSPDTKVLTFAHWQLEDGFREGVRRGDQDLREGKGKTGGQGSGTAGGRAGARVFAVVPDPADRRRTGRCAGALRQLRHSQPVFHAAVALHRREESLERGYTAGELQLAREFLRRHARRARSLLQRILRRLPFSR
ncbi:MAG: hypothetical protein L6W00_04560 [Lentisphaeria bacterium]|nr:MAG: hypothetical protein L6W00_04560 [Lentisphaeria bacterium]